MRPVQAMFKWQGFYSQTMIDNLTTFKDWNEMEFNLDCSTFHANF